VATISETGEAAGLVGVGVLEQAAKKMITPQMKNMPGKYIFLFMCITPEIKASIQSTSRRKPLSGCLTELN
jgi:hypothetical protein